MIPEVLNLGCYKSPQPLWAIESLKSEFAPGTFNPFCDLVCSDIPVPSEEFKSTLQGALSKLQSEGVTLSNSNPASRKKRLTQIITQVAQENAGHLALKGDDNDLLAELFQEFGLSDDSTPPSPAFQSPPSVRRSPTSLLSTPEGAPTSSLPTSPSTTSLFASSPSVPRVTARIPPLPPPPIPKQPSANYSPLSPQSSSPTSSSPDIFSTSNSLATSRSNLLNDIVVEVVCVEGVIPPGIPLPDSQFGTFFS